MVGNNKINKRILIVGVARSGTTLLQSMLYSHSGIFSFPETHFFDYTIPTPKIARLFKVHGKKSHSIIREYFSRINASRNITFSDKKYFSTRGWVKYIIEILDEFTRNNGYNIWLEKTPRHLNYINVIERATEDSFFLHVLRPGKDVVASLYGVSNKNPHRFGGKQSIDDCIKRWQKEVKLSLKHGSKQNHILVRYEKLIQQPREILQKICDRLSLPFQKQMLEYQNKADNLRFPEETWKEKNSKSLSKGDKFSRYFNKQEQEYIIKRTSRLENKIKTKIPDGIL